MQVLHDPFGRAGRAERLMTDQDFKEHQAQAVQIGARGDWLCAQLFRRYDGERPHDLPGFGLIGSKSQVFSDAEIGQVRILIAVE